MHPGTLHSGDGATKQWPDFYSILDSSPETDGETLRRSINTLYVKANEQSDHRELSTRFYNQVLTQKVLPQCRRILLDEPVRQAYNQQWYLHRDGSDLAKSYQEFIEEISKDAGTARTLLLSDDELSILPSIGTASGTVPGASPLTSRKNPDATTSAGVAASDLDSLPSTDSAQPLQTTEIIEGEEVVNPDSPSLTNSNSQSVVVAPVSPPAGTRKKAFPMIPAVAALLILGVGGFMWNASKQEEEVETVSPLIAHIPDNPPRRAADIAPTPLPPPPPAVTAADSPRTRPMVNAGSSVAVDLSKSFNTVGITRDARVFPADSGFDSVGAAFPASLVGRTLNAQGVRFAPGAPDVNNIVTARGGLIDLPRQKFSSLWLLGSATETNQRGQTFIVTYTDGSLQTLWQNMSDWFSPQSFPGESYGIKAHYRNKDNGTKDARPFSLYTYSFALDKTKTVQSLKLPNNRYVHIAAVSLAK